MSVSSSPCLSPHSTALARPTHLSSAADRLREHMMCLVPSQDIARPPNSGNKSSSSLCSCPLTVAAPFSIHLFRLDSTGASASFSAAMNHLGTYQFSTQQSPLVPKTSNLPRLEIVGLFALSLTLVSLPTEWGVRGKRHDREAESSPTLSKDKYTLA
jgi:hypothetical protein